MDTVLKRTSVTDLCQRYGERNFVSLATEMFGELHNYSIIVPVEFKEDGGALLSSVEKIDGPNLWNCVVDQEFVSVVSKLYENIARYLTDKWSKDELCLCDINSGSQYVYGKRIGNTEKHAYLIDTDLYMCQGEDSVLHTIKWFVRHARGMEQRCQCSFLGVRHQLLSSDIPLVDDIKGFVLGEKLGAPPIGPAIPEFRTL